MTAGPPGFRIRKRSATVRDETNRTMGFGGWNEPDSEKDRIASVRRRLDRFPWMFLLTGPLLNLLIFSSLHLLKLARESPPDRFFPALLEAIISVARRSDASGLLVLFVISLILSFSFFYAFYKFDRSMQKRKDVEFPELLGFYRATWCSYVGAILVTGFIALWFGSEEILGGEGGLWLMFITPFPYLIYMGGPFVGYIIGDAIFIPPKPKEPGERSEWTGM